MSDPGNRTRAALVNELYDDLYDVINEHGFMSGLTLAEIVGTLEILKHDVIIDQSENITDEDPE